MISPSIISRIISDRSLTESQKADSIYGIVQDAFIDGYSIGTETLVSSIRQREVVITEHTTATPQYGDKYIALYDWNTNEYNIFKDKTYRIAYADVNTVCIKVGHTIAEFPIAIFNRNLKLKK